MSKFLAFEDRLIIEKGLRENKSFGAIAKLIGKDRTTIAKEVKKYAFDQKTGYSSYPYNACIHRVSCKEKNICGTDCTAQSKAKCSICNKCNDKCKYFQEEICQGKVRYRPRYKKPELKIDRGCRIGRNYQDFQKFIKDNPELPIVE